MTRSDYWTPQEFETLTRLRAEGKTYRQMAEAIGTKTMGAVQKKIGRTKTIVRLERHDAWSDAQANDLKRYADEGMYARDIGDLIGKSKSAVIAYAARNSIKLKNPPHCAFVKNRKRPAIAKTNPDEGAVAPSAKGGSNIALVEASFVPEPDLPETDDPFSPKGCRWPCGDVGTPTFRYCQREQHVEEGGRKNRYCAHHKAKARGAQQPLVAKERKRPGWRGNYADGGEYFGRTFASGGLW